MAMSRGEHIGADATRVLLKGLDRANGKRISLGYDSMNQLLSTSGGAITVAEILEQLGVDVVYAEPEYEEIIVLCEQLDKEGLERILSIADRLASDWQRDSRIDALQPTARAFALVQRRTRESERLNSIPRVLERLWKDHHGSTRIPFIAMPEVCEYLGVSPHWVMRLPNDVPFYCPEQPMIDVILDRYSFISARNKPLFLELLKSYAERRDEE